VRSSAVELSRKAKRDWPVHSSSGELSRKTKTGRVSQQQASTAYVPNASVMPLTRAGPVAVQGPRKSCSSGCLDPEHDEVNARSSAVHHSDHSSSANGRSRLQ